MRTVFIIENLQLAGAERIVAELAQAADREGCESQIITLREENNLEGSLYQDLRWRPLLRLGEFRWPWSAPKAAWRLREELRRLAPDVVAIHSPKAAVVAAMAKPKAPTVWVLHGHDVCWDGTTVRQKLARSLQRWTLRRLGRAVTAVSPSLADHSAEGLGMARREIAVIPNGIDTERFRFERKTPGKDPVICVLGRLIPLKAPLKALEAFGFLKKEFPAARLWFVGEGSMRAELEAEAGRRGWNGAVTLWGNVRQPEEKLREATVLWMPSESEGFGMACVEAMASGLPVLGFDVRGVHDLLQGGCGVLAAPTDAKGLAEQTARLLRDAERYLGIAETARARVERRYSLERMCSGHYELMRSLCGRGKAPSSDAADVARATAAFRLLR